jgi:aryl-alcohol dehydrogenase-like predicted oxidoreductase
VNLHEALERSLERLQLQTVDGFYLHSAPERVDEAMGALNAERQGGRTKRIGICNADVNLLEQAHTAAGLDLCQNVYNLALPDAAREVLPWCQKRGVTFVAYSPLGAGFLTGKYGVRGELCPAGTRFHVVPGHRDVYFRPECFSALERLRAASQTTGIPQHLLALRWAMSNPGVAVVLIGATRPEHLDNAAAAAKLAVDEPVIAGLEAAGAAA